MSRKYKLNTAAFDTTKKQFAAELSSHTRLTLSEIDELFPTAKDREELKVLFEIVKNAADENEMKAKLINYVSETAGAVVKIARQFFVGV